jgi:hypothetical protein
MSVVLRQSLELIGSYIAPPLFPPDALASLCDAEPLTTSDVRVGFECRLDDTAAPADLSQLIDVRDGGAERLRLLARARACVSDEEAHSIWSRIEALACASRSGEAPVDAIWLEYDLAKGLGPSSVPSVFANLANRGPADWTALLGLLHRLGAADSQGALEHNLARAAEGAASFGGRLRGICGVMTARQHQSRIMILGIPAEAQADYLLSIGWRGDVRELAGILRGLGSDTREVGLSLELAPELQPRVGLELRLDGPPVDPEGRRRPLDALVARGLCTPAKRDALLGWAGQVTPGNAGGKRWPESLLLASLLRPHDEFGVFHRTLHHLKIAAGGSHTVAKVYLGFVHTWLEPTPTGYVHVL